MSTHRKIVEHVKNLLATEGHPYAEFFEEKSDEQFLYLLFRSYRGTQDDGKGLRLTQVGLDVLSTAFKPYEIRLHEGHRFTPRDFVYMDRAAQLPYYMENPVTKTDQARLVVFEGYLGVMLKLNDGSVTNLRTLSKGWG